MDPIGGRDVLFCFLTGTDTPSNGPRFGLSLFVGTMLGLMKVITVGIGKDGAPRMSYLIINWCVKSGSCLVLLSRKSLRRNCNCWFFLITTLLSSWGHWPHQELTWELESIKIACVYKSPFLQSISTTTQILLTLKFFLKCYRGKQDYCNYKFFLGRTVRLLFFCSS